MAIPARTSRPGTFFVTSGTYNRRRLFQVERNAELLIETLQHYRAEGHYKLHAFVVMPDHIHLLLTPTKPSNEQLDSSREASPIASLLESQSGNEASLTTASEMQQTTASAITISIRIQFPLAFARRPKRIHFPPRIRHGNSTIALP